MKKCGKKICTVKKFIFDDFRFFSFFILYDFLNFDFPLDYCSVNKNKHFPKNHPSNLIVLASRELFLFFSFVFALSLAEITQYFVINMTKPSKFLKQKKIYSRLFLFFIVFIIYIGTFLRKIILL